MKYTVHSLILILSTLFITTTFSQNVGVNTDTPKQKLDVYGKINIWNDSTIATEGAIRYNSQNKEFEGFNGFRWVSFTGSLEGRWDIPTSLQDNISPDSTWAQSPDVAIDNSGNVIICWDQFGGDQWHIYKSEFRNGMWDHPQDLSDYIGIGTTHAQQSKVAMDNSGNAIIIWKQFDGTYSKIFKSEYRNGTWVHPASLSESINPGTTPPNYLQVEMDDTGNAIIAWSQYDGFNDQIYIAEYRIGVWSFPTDATDHISPVGYDARNPQIAMDNIGNAIVVWEQKYSSDWGIYKSEYRDGSWDHPTISQYISLDGGSFDLNASSAKVAMDDLENAIITYSQSNINNYQIYISEYQAGFWTHPAFIGDHISPGGSDAFVPSVSMDDLSNACVSWYQWDGSDNQIFKSEYRLGSWTHPPGINVNISSNGVEAQKPKVKMANNGDAIIAWKQSDYVIDQVFKSEFRNGSWNYPFLWQDNVSPDGTDVISLELDMNDNGNAIIVWRQSDGSFNQIFYCLF